MRAPLRRRLPAVAVAPLHLLLLALVVSTACAGLSRFPRNPAMAPRITTVAATLEGQPFELHLASPVHPVADVLVLYASGDGGWFGAAVDMFRAIGDAGYYAVGLSSKALLHRKRSSTQALTVAEIEDDYRTILARAAGVLNLPADHRVVLTGWSRGATLAVVSGAGRHQPANLAGVIAIGLGVTDNLQVSSDTDDDPDDDGPINRDPASFDTYALLAQVAPGRCAVIQATGDRYLQASRARVLFGADTPTRRFYEVPAKNHRFGGGEAEFVKDLGAALNWIVGR
jgi:hypothetical protein